jgi:hypothetical protein
VRHNHPGKLGIVGAILGAAALFAASVTGAGATSVTEYVAAMKASGYTVGAGRTVAYSGFKVSATTMSAVTGRPGDPGVAGRAELELMQYGSEALLREDWDVVNGQAPRPRQGSNQFAGRTLYWNHDSILIVDFRAPNDVSVARAAAQVFLSGGAGLVNLAPSAGIQGDGFTPPATGDAGLVEAAGASLPAWLRLVAVIVTVAGLTALLLTSGSSRYVDRRSRQ